MQPFINWVSFAGAWLLFAGPIFQAAQELLDEEYAQYRDRSSQRSRPEIPRVSPFWWFLPPVKLILERRRAQRYRELVIRSMPPEELEVIMAFISKANGWLLVAGGGLLLAVKETYEVTEAHDWSWRVLVVLVLVMTYLSIVYTVLSIVRAEKIRDLARSD